PQLGGVQDRASYRVREHQVVVALRAGGLEISVEFSATRSATGTARGERGISACPIGRGCSCGARGSLRPSNRRRACGGRLTRLGVGPSSRRSCISSVLLTCRAFPSVQACLGDWALVAVRRWSARVVRLVAPRRVVGESG